jgi:hypothetical protein
MARGGSGQGDGGAVQLLEMDADKGTQAQEEEEEEEEQQQSDIDHYSDNDDSGLIADSSPSPLALRALQAFSLLFSQVDYTLADGFTYVSSDAPTFTLEQLQAFARDFLDEAWSDVDLVELFQELDGDGDGHVTQEEWTLYFDRISAAYDSDSVPLPSLHAAHVTSSAALAGVQLEGAAAASSSHLPAAADGSGSVPAVAAAAVDDAGVEDDGFAAEMQATLQQLQQQLVAGAAHALQLHDEASSSQHSPAPPPPARAAAAQAPP